ncbi:MAG: hypothetical protein ACYCZY_07980 [Lacisediminihabitans sp.]
MLLAYLDESYDKRKYWIASVVCPDAHVRSLTRALDEVVQASAKKFPNLSPFGELHGHALFHGKDDWSSLATMPRARIGVYRNALAEIAMHDVRIIVRGVNIEGPHRRYYRITTKGRRSLSSFVVQWGRFRNSVDAILGERE